MRCRAKWQYMLMTIGLNVPGCVALTDDQLEESLRHEMIHGLVNELRAEDPTPEQHNHEERVVTALSNAFAWVRQSGYDAGKSEAMKRKGRKR